MRNMKNLKPSNIKLKSSLESIISLRLDSNLSYPMWCFLLPRLYLYFQQFSLVKALAWHLQIEDSRRIFTLLFLIDIGSLLIWFLISRTCTGKEAVTVRGMVFDHGCFFCQADVEERLRMWALSKQCLRAFSTSKLLILYASKLNAL